MNRQLAAFAAAVSLFCAGCGASGADFDVLLPPEAATLRRVHSDTSGADLPVWRVDMVPALRIGSLDGPDCTRFEGSLSATELPDGRLVVGDQGARRIHVYSAGGECLATFGNRGDGPGEFPSSLFEVASGGGDTIVAFVQLHSILLHFTASSGYVRSARLTADSLKAFASTDQRVGRPKLHGGGWLLLEVGERTRQSDSENPTGVRDTVRFLLARGHADRRDLGEWAGSNAFTFRVLSESGALMEFGLPVPHQSSTYIATAPHGTRTCIGDGFQPAMACYDVSGDGVVLTWSAPAIPVSQTAIDEWAAQFAERQSQRPTPIGAVPRAPLEAALKGVRAPDHDPFFTGVLVDSEANVWVETYPALPADSGRRGYLVFGKDGKLRARAAFPSGWLVREIHRDHILAVQRDSLGVNSVGRLAIRR